MVILFIHHLCKVPLLSIKALTVTQFYEGLLLGAGACKCAVYHCKIC